MAIGVALPSLPRCLPQRVVPMRARARPPALDRAERIEGCLVARATRYLNAAVVENDDLDAAALERAPERALARPAPFLPP